MSQNAKSKAMRTASGAQPWQFTEAELSGAEARNQNLTSEYAANRHDGRMREELAMLRASFDRMPLGILVLAADGRVLERNEEASRLLKTGSNIFIAASGRLRLTNFASCAKFRAALVRLTTQNQSLAPTSIVVGRRSSLDIGALVLHLCGIPASSAPDFVRKGRIIAYLCELICHPTSQFATQVLRATLELTPMEAAVILSMRDHNDPAEAAVELGLAVSTVRSHLKHLFRKTGTTRQSELLRLVDRVLSAVPC